MTKERNTFSRYWAASVTCVLAVLFLSCDLLRPKTEDQLEDAARVPVARAGNSFLFRDELKGIAPQGSTLEDSASRVQAYVNSWIRKQLLIEEAMRNVDISEAEVERKILDYRYSIIAYEYQTLHIKKYLDTLVSDDEIKNYYAENKDNFILKQNIVRASFIKVPRNAPRAEKIKSLLFSSHERDKKELKSYCLSFSTAYQLADSAWMVFDELVTGSPLTGIPNKIQFLESNPYYETSDETFFYFFKVEEYRISDSYSPLDFVKDEIRNIILNKRKVELVKELEDKVYKEAAANNEFEVY